jgi:hypothetical protein
MAIKFAQLVVGGLLFFMAMAAIHYSAWFSSISFITAFTFVVLPKISPFTPYTPRYWNNRNRIIAASLFTLIGFGFFPTP